MRKSDIDPRRCWFCCRSFELGAKIEHLSHSRDRQNHVVQPVFELLYIGDLKKEQHLKVFVEARQNVALDILDIEIWLFDWGIRRFLSCLLLRHRSPPFSYRGKYVLSLSHSV